MFGGKKITVNVPFAAVVERGDNYFGYVDAPNTSISIHAPEAKAKKFFKRQLAALVAEALKAKENTRAVSVACTNGDIFTVRYAFGSWGYSITGPGRKFGSAVSGRNTFEETLQDARNHATQNGGILWECGL